jgi:hypothetical protein
MKKRFLRRDKIVSLKGALGRNRTDATEKPFDEAIRSREGRAAEGAFNLLQNDIHTLLEYIEPDSRNFKTFSHRTFELLLRACTEFESHVKIIFEKNRHPLGPFDNIKRFSDLEGPMKLSEYEIECRLFDFPTFRPFESFANPSRDHRSPAWYKSYNSAKHNRANQFDLASLENVIFATGGVYAILDAQYGLGYCSNDSLQRPYAPSDRDLFMIRKLPTWTSSEEYSDFDWLTLKTSTDPFDFHPIPVR